MTFASYLSLLRALMIIPIILLHGHHIIVFLLFLLAAITDWLDGYIARKTKTETNTGALLDLLADKILVSLSLIWIIFLYQDPYIFFPSLILSYISEQVSLTSLENVKSDFISSLIFSKYFGD